MNANPLVWGNRRLPQLANLICDDDDDEENANNVDDEVLSESVKIYPNPVGDILTIESPMLEITKVEIFSLLGATVKDIKDDFGTIYMDDLSKGIYMIKIQSEYGTTVKKLIKQ